MTIPKKTSKPLISRNVLIELREYFVEYQVLRGVDDAFRSAGIVLGNEQNHVTGARRQLVEQYYASLNLESPDDVRKLLKVIENQILYCKLNYPDTTPSPIYKVLIVLEQNGFREEKGSIINVQTPLSFQQMHIYGINSASILQDWERMIPAIEEDPEDAITSARALVESTCKSILDEMKIKYENGWDLPRLYKIAADALQLSPSGYQEQTFKQILGGCSSIVQSLAEIRNLFGDAHGKGKTHYRASPRHARLAVNAAGTVAIFLLETLEYRNSLAESNVGPKE
ncbi:MAG: abortive infection family protein [Chloroflexota bacterium]